MKIPGGRLLTDLSVPLAMLLCLAALGLAVEDPQSSAETGYLALLATAVLLPLATVPRRTPWVVEGTALLATAAVWALPAGDTRGAVVGLLLAGCAALEIGRRLENESGDVGWTLAVPAAIALQMLYRADRLLAPELDPRTLVGLIGLPAAGAAAAVWLWPRYGRRSAVAVGLLLALAPGWRVAPVLTLLALAAASRLRRQPIPAAALLAATVAAGAVWRPPFGVLLVITATVVWAGARPRTQIAPAALALAAAVLPLAPHDWATAFAGVGRWLVLLPALAMLERRRWPAMVSALLLAIAGGRWLAEGSAALAPAVGAAALLLRTSRPMRQLQRLWAGFLAFGAALLACYPWLRSDPLPELLERIALRDEPRPALLFVIGAGLLGAALELLRRRGIGSRRWPPAVGAVALAAGVLAALPGPAVRPLEGVPLELTSGQPSRTAQIEPAATVSRLVLDSYLSYGIEVPAGRTVAHVRVTGEAGERLEWEIVSGTDTGEWAARRPDVAALGTVATPRAWLSWVVPEGFFAQRYRAVKPARRPLRARHLEISLAEGLPPHVTLAVFHLELRR